MARKKKDRTPVLPELDANRHQDTRKNIPTEELRDFVAEDESKPPKMLYPRDPSLDPQLVWKGKDEQDREPLEVDRGRGTSPNRAAFCPGSSTTSTRWISTARLSFTSMTRNGPTA